MNILFITNTPPPVVDGVGDYTLNLAREFARQGHKAGIVCRNDSRVKADYDDVEVFPVVNGWNRKEAAKVKRIIKEGQYEVLSLQYVPHGFEPHGLPLGLVGFLKEVKKTNIKVFTFCHEVYWRYRGCNLKYLAESLLMAHISKKILKQSDFVATSIGHYARMMKQLCGKDAPTIPITSNIPAVKEDEAALKALKERVAANGEFVVAFIGKRNMAVVSEAVKRLLADHANIKLLLIGKTNNIGGIDEKHIYRTGILDIEQLSQYVSIADCMVMPEDNKTGCSFKSGSLAAALSFGLPVITSKGIMTDEVLHDKENILFVDSSSAESYYNAIASLVNDESFTQKVSRGASVIGATFTWRNTYQRYMEILG